MEGVIGLIVCICLGGVIKYFWSSSEILRTIVNKYLIYFGLPFFIAISLIGNPTPRIRSYILVISLLLVGITGIFFFAVKILRFDSRRKAAIFLCSAFGNWAFLGIPVTYILFDRIGLVMASVAALVAGVFHYSLGIFLSNLYVGKWKMAISRTFKTPLIYGLLAALILSRFSIVIPKILFVSASSTIYLSALVVGLSLGIKQLDKSLWTGCLLKFIFWPLLAFFALLFTGFTWTERLVIITLAFMPPALVNTNFSIEYDLDTTWTSNITTIGTIGFLIAFLVTSLLI